MDKDMNLPNIKFYELNKCVICGKEFWSLKSRNQKSCSSKCSGIFVARNPDRIVKIKKTKKERYGSETFVNPEKAKETCFKKYGVDNASKSNIVIEKIKQSNNEKFGVDWSFQSNDIKQKIKKTCRDRYGVENISFNKDVQKRKRETELFKAYQRILNSNRLKDLVDPLFSLDDYKGVEGRKRYKFKCKQCGLEFDDHLDDGHIPRCCVCYPTTVLDSKIENELYEFIKEILPNENIIRNDRTLVSPQELDVYIPSKNVAIELDGLFWHSEIGGKKNNYYHVCKTKLCEMKSVHLIHIFEDEWMNKKNIIKHRLKHILGISNDKIYARKCEIKEIDAQICNEFLNHYHLQGQDNSLIRLGAFYQSELVSVMTFGAGRIALGNKNIINEYELYRFCTSKNVIGIAGKLLNYFIKKYTPSKIISYADRRFSDIKDVFYSKIGFRLIDETDPNYWYIKNPYTERHYRFNFRKDQLSNKLEQFDPNLSEWENMKLNGYDRIWDCGHLKYEWSPK